MAIRPDHARPREGRQMRLRGAGAGASLPTADDRGITTDAIADALTSLAGAVRSTPAGLQTSDRAYDLAERLRSLAAAVERAAEGKRAANRESADAVAEARVAAARAAAESAAAERAAAVVELATQQAKRASWSPSLATVIADFKADEPSELSVAVGERLALLPASHGAERAVGWVYARSVAGRQRASSGLQPATVGFSLGPELVECLAPCGGQGPGARDVRAGGHAVDCSVARSKRCGGEGGRGC